MLIESAMFVPGYQFDFIPTPNGYLVKAIARPSRHPVFVDQLDRTFRTRKEAIAFCKSLIQPC